MAYYYKFLFNYLSIGLGYDELTSEGFFLRTDKIVIAMDTFVVIIMYVIIATFIGMVNYISRTFIHIDTFNGLLTVAFIINLFSEYGFVEGDELLTSRTINLVIRSIAKILTLLIVYGILAHMIESL